MNPCGSGSDVAMIFGVTTTRQSWMMSCWSGSVMHWLEKVFDLSVCWVINLGFGSPGASEYCSEALEAVTGERARVFSHTAWNIGGSLVRRS